MKASPKLLRDVLNDASGRLRQEIYEASVRELRRKRRVLRLRRMIPLAVAAVLVLSVTLFFVTTGHRGRKEARRLPEPIRPGPALAYVPVEVVTNHGPAMATVESWQYPSEVVENSAVQRPLEIVDDAELLALFPDKPVGLIADSRGSVQLVFLDPPYLTR